MKLFQPLVFLLFSLLFSCSQEIQKERIPSNTEDKEGAINKQASVLIERLLAPSLEGDLRGVSLGDKPRAVLKLEPYEPVETNPKYITYEFPLMELDSVEHQNHESKLENQETVDVKYALNDGLIHSIEIDIYVNSVERLDSINQQLIDHFNDLYGSYPSEENDVYVWRPDGEKVLQLNRIEKQVTNTVTDFGIKLYLMKEENA